MKGRFAMTKKHFIALADYFRKPGMMPAAVDHAITRAQVNQHLRCSEATEDGDPIPELTDSQQNRLRREVLRAVAQELADFCIDQNGRFDRYRWLDYIADKCGPNGGAVRA
jgi:hypothetical protein